MKKSPKIEIGKPEKIADFKFSGDNRISRALQVLHTNHILNKVTNSRKEYSLQKRFRWTFWSVMCKLITNGKCWYGPLEDDPMFKDREPSEYRKRRKCRICKSSWMNPPML
jgi:hypothetical protein